MSENNVKRVAFVRDLFLPWEVDLTSPVAKKGAYFSEIDLERLPSGTSLTIAFSPQTQQPEHLIFAEKNGNRTVVVPASLTYQYCEKSEISLATPFRRQ